VGPQYSGVESNSLAGCRRQSAVIRLKIFQLMASLPVPGNPTAWLPKARVARAWQALVAGTPFD
jgi:hypothetical protein